MQFVVVGRLGIQLLFDFYTLFFPFIRYPESLLIQIFAAIY